MKAFLMVAAGGALGATARYWVYQLTHQFFGHQFPLATLIVNIVGSLLMGLLIETFALLINPSESIRLLLAVGLLGAFTTFSTFALDYAVLYKRGELMSAALYVMGSVAGSIGALFFGMALARALLQKAV